MDINWQSLLEQILAIAIPILVPAFCVWFTGQFALLWAKIKDRYPGFTYYVDEAVETAVHAVEQLKASGVIPPGAGEHAKQMGIDITVRILAEHGVKVDKDKLKVIADLIEANLWTTQNMPGAPESEETAKAMGFRTDDNPCQ